MAFFSSFKHFSYLGKLEPDPEMGGVLPVTNDLLIEDGSYLLLETGFKIVLEP
jgi:hypothetical protein